MPILEWNMMAGSGCQIALVSFIMEEERDPLVSLRLKDEITAAAKHLVSRELHPLTITREGRSGIRWSPAFHLRIGPAGLIWKSFACWSTIPVIHRKLKITLETIAVLLVESGEFAPQVILHIAPYRQNIP
jgi:hypothetical protein